MSSKAGEHEAKAQTGTCSARKVRPANLEDADAIGAILAEAFTGLLASCFFTTDRKQLSGLLATSLRGGFLRIADILVCEQSGEVVGVAVLQAGKPVTAGRFKDYFHLIRTTHGAPRALFSVLGAFSYVLFDARSPYADDLLYIEAIAVSVNFRRQGIGTALMLAAEEWSAAQGRSRIALHVIPRREDARRLYEFHGYAPCRRIPLKPIRTWLFRWSRSISADLLEKHLNAP